MHYWLYSLIFTVSSVGLALETYLLLLLVVVLLGDQHQLALGLVASVLEPDFHLRLGEAQRLRELGALGAGQVALPAETTLQLEHLLAQTNKSQIAQTDPRDSSSSCVQR